MKANKYKRFLEFVAVLCLFLALGVDWFEGVDPMPNRTVFEHFSITSEYSSYIPPEVAERAVDQAIEAAERREQRNQTPRAKVRVGVMGEKYTVENLQFDGFLSWKRKPVDIKAEALARIREITRLALEVSIRGLAFVDTNFSARAGSFSCSVRPIDTESFNPSVYFHLYPDLIADFPDNSDSLLDFACLEATQTFLAGLLEEDKPLMIEEAAA